MHNVVGYVVVVDIVDCNHSSSAVVGCNHNSFVVVVGGYIAVVVVLDRHSWYTAVVGEFVVGFGVGDLMRDEFGGCGRGRGGGVGQQS